MKARQIEDYLQDILEAISAAEEFILGMTLEEFKQDKKTIFAVTRAIEIIGEATKQIPPTIREEYPQIPWKSIAGMRDKMIHQYFGINLQVLWDTVEQDLPPLKTTIKEIFNNISNSL